MRFPAASSGHPATSIVTRSSGARIAWISSTARWGRADVSPSSFPQSPCSGLTGSGAEGDETVLGERKRGDLRPLFPAPANHRLRSDEHTSELQSLMRISYAVFCLKKKKTENNNYKVEL